MVKQNMVHSLFLHKPIQKNGETLDAQTLEDLQDALLDEESGVHAGWPYL